MHHLVILIYLIQNKVSLYVPQAIIVNDKSICRLLYMGVQLWVFI